MGMNELVYNKWIELPTHGVEGGTGAAETSGIGYERCVGFIHSRQFVISNIVFVVRNNHKEGKREEVRVVENAVMQGGLY